MTEAQKNLYQQVMAAPSISAEAKEEFRKGWENGQQDREMRGARCRKAIPLGRYTEVYCMRDRGHVGKCE